MAAAGLLCAGLSRLGFYPAVSRDPSDRPLKSVSPVTWFPYV